jgi:Recombinase zinc beta ribbon domain/Recombinase
LERYQAVEDLGSVDATVVELQQRGWTTKSWVTAKDKPHAGTPFTAASLTRMLGNELYTGAVAYRGQLYRGEQPRIIAPRRWKQVNGILRKIRSVPAPKERNQNGALLQGLLYCSACGKPMGHTSTAKGEHRYRYYVCRTGSGTCAGQSVSAPTIEASVREQLESLARQPAGKYLRKHLKPLGLQWRSSAPLDLHGPIRKVIARVSYDATTCGVTIQLQSAKEKRHDAAAQ